MRHHVISLRVRPNPLLLYCIAGQGTLDLHGRKSEVGAGDFVLLPRDVPHSFASDSLQPWTVAWAYFSGSRSDDFSALVSGGEVSHVGVRADLIEALLWQMAWPDKGYSDSMLARASARLAATLAEFAVAAEEKGNAAGEIHVDRARSWMMERLDRAISLTEVAAISGLSPYHFVRKFREATGYSPIMFHTVLRMQRACELLDRSGLAVGLVGEQLGYFDPQHFSRVFKRIMGASPRSYRANALHGGRAH